MRLYVYVLQAKDLPLKDYYVKLQVGKFKSKTRILKNTSNPVWNEEFLFRVHDVDGEVVVSILHHEDDSGLFHMSGELMGRVRIPVCSVAAEDHQILPPTWFSIERRPKNSMCFVRDSGKILLSVSLHGKGHANSANHLHYSNINIEGPEELEASCTSNVRVSSKTVQRKIPEGKQIIKAIANRLERLLHKNEIHSRNNVPSELSILSDYEDCLDEFSSHCSFEEAMETLHSSDNEQEMPENLQGGILLDQIYVVSTRDLNRFLFDPGSHFKKELEQLQGTTDVQEGPWEWRSGDTSCLTRVVTYRKSATKLVKAVKATEQQTYIIADGKQFCLYTNVSTPEVPYGNNFKVELLYKIMPGPELSSGEESSHLIVSWGICFHQNTMIRGMIGGVRQGLKESFDQFSNLLSKHFKVLDSKDSRDKDDVLANLQTAHQSDWELALEYFWNFTVVSATFMVLYVIVHILFCEPHKLNGLEFYGLDLPDTLGELFTCGMLIIQLEHVYRMISHFVQARWQRGSDHGIKAQGAGWILTVALIEGRNIASLESIEFSDPYVVFACNGKTKTSSVKLQARDPEWNEILEFDAMEELPSVLDVEVFDFDGPFGQATSLGHAEINFLKHTSTELADLWVSLEGKFSESSQSKLHLRIFLDNKKGVETIKEYLTRMGREIGKKLNIRSPHRNSAFQKLFGLPPEEFLISDFTCQLKRKLPLQGRLFLSARILGFYVNFFGHKTKFFFLWEDIEDIQVLPPSLASVGSLSLLIILREGRGFDARHGARAQDEEGRLRFHFHSFVSFNEACRTITSLWRTRTWNSEQKTQIAEQQQDQEDGSIKLEEAGIILDADESRMSKVYCDELPIKMELVMNMFAGGDLEHKIMEKSGCLNYENTTWEPQKMGVSERHLSYKFNRCVSFFGGDVTCTQQKSPIANDEGWIVNEVMTLHNVPFGDHFRVHLRYKIERSALAHNACMCDVYLWIVWLKNSEFQQRITQNITEKFMNRLKEIFEMIQKEILFTTQ